MNSWFDIKSIDKSLSDNDRLSLEDIQDSYNIIKANVDQEVTELNGDTTKIFIGGFS